MPRTAGAKNKSSIVKTDNEDEFLSDVLHGHAKWKSRAAIVKEAGGNPDKELQYAEAYRVLLNKFSQLENEQQ